MNAEVKPNVSPRRDLLRLYSHVGARKLLFVFGMMLLAACGGGGSGGGGMPAPAGLSYASPAMVNTTSAVNLMPTVTGTVTTFSVIPALPAGLTLDATTGAITGMPTVTTGPTTYTITATNAGGSTTFALNLTVNLGPPDGLSYPSPQTLNTTSVVNLMPTVTGTVTTYTVTPALPAGVALDGITGAITGTPSTASAQNVYTIRASNAAGSTAFALTLIVNGPLVISSAAPPSSGTVGTIYNGGIRRYCLVNVAPLCISCDPSSNPRSCQQRVLGRFVFRAVGGVPPYAWSATSLPSGLLLSASGSLSGTPTVAGTYNVDVTVTDSASPTGQVSKNYSIVIAHKGFRATGGMGTARFRHTATLLGDGKVLVVGGRMSAAADGGLKTAELFDPASGNFGATGSMSEDRSGHTATLLNDGTVLVIGGATGGLPNGPSDHSVNSALLFDPAAGSFTPTGSMGTARTRPTATLLNDGTVLVTGGFNLVTPDRLGTAEIFDPATGSFKPTGSLATARGDHTATLLNDGTVLVAGGDDLGSAEIFDPATGLFTPTGSMTTARSGHTATLLNDGRVLVAGGVPAGSADAAATAELFDPAVGSFASTGNMGTARVGHTATLLDDGEVLVTGGNNSNGTDAPGLGSAEIFDAVNETFTPSGSMANARGLHTATLLNDGTTVLVTGGIDGQTALSAAELYQ